MPRWESVLESAPVMAKWEGVEGMVMHVFSHFTFEIRVVVGHVKTVQGVWVHPKNLHAEALPSVMRKIIKHAGIDGRASQSF